jgi:hypothetical protein
VFFSGPGWIERRNVNRALDEARARAAHHIDRVAAPAHLYRLTELGMYHSRGESATSIEFRITVST